MHCRRLALASALVVTGILGSWGMAQAADDSRDHSCIPRNDHSSTDLYMHPQCPGNRDIRDDDDNHGGSSGPEDRGPFGDVLKF